mgnify:CR=1 FL=1
MKLDKLLERLDYTVVQGSDSTEVTTLINDSRKVEEGSVFVCISGAVSDGHKYAKEVVEKGATVLVVQDEVEVPEEFKDAGRGSCCCRERCRSAGKCDCN